MRERNDISTSGYTTEKSIPLKLFGLAQPDSEVISAGWLRFVLCFSSGCFGAAVGQETLWVLLYYVTNFHPRAMRSEDRALQ